MQKILRKSELSDIIRNFNMLIGTDSLLEATYLKLLFWGFYLQNFCSSEHLSDQYSVLGTLKAMRQDCKSLITKLHEMENSVQLNLGISVQLNSVSQCYLTLCDPMNRSTPGLPAHHQPYRVHLPRTVICTFYHDIYYQAMIKVNAITQIVAM